MGRIKATEAGINSWSLARIKRNSAIVGMENLSLRLSLKRRVQHYRKYRETAGMTDKLQSIETIGPVKPSDPLQADYEEGKRFLGNK